MKRLVFLEFVLVFVACVCNAADKNKLPSEEKKIANTIDHWRLGFFDQVRRFEKVEKLFKGELGDKAPKKFMTGIQSALVKVPLNKYWFKGEYTNKISLSAARNEYESFQVAAIPYMGKELKKVELQSTNLKELNGKASIPADAIKIYRVGRIKALNSYCPNAMSDSLWPDPLEPNTPQTALKTDLALFWVQIKVPANATPGDYSGQMQLVGDDEKISIKINLHVYNFTLPDRVPFPVAVWTHNPKKNDLDYYRKIFAEFLKHGIDPINAGKIYKLNSSDFKEFDKTIKFCLDRNQQIFDIPRTGSKITSTKPLYDHLIEKGWIDKVIIYTNQDEPSPQEFKANNIPYYKEMKKNYPQLRVFMASEYKKNIDEGCDIWLNDLSTGKGMDIAVKDKGKAALWNYYCGIPIKCDYVASRENQPLMLLERDSIEHRLPFWIAWKYGVEGIFIWAGNMSTPKKLPNSNYWQINEDGKWPYCGNRNGDGFLMYPNCTPSIRMKVLRDGLEDYGYLMALKKALPEIKDKKLNARAKEILEIPKILIVNPHYFNRNPEVLLNMRKEIGRILDLHKLDK